MIIFDECHKARNVLSESAASSLITASRRARGEGSGRTAAARRRQAQQQQQQKSGGSGAGGATVVGGKAGSMAFGPSGSGTSSLLQTEKPTKPGTDGKPDQKGSKELKAGSKTSMAILRLQVSGMLRAGIPC